MCRGIRTAGAAKTGERGYTKRVVRLSVLVCACIIFGFLQACGADGRQLYVDGNSPSASDRYPRFVNSEKKPWKTIQRGFDEVLPGDELIIEAGNYEHQEALHLKHAGTERNPITIRGRGKPVISGGIRAPIFLLQNKPAADSQAEWVVFDGLSIRSTGRHPVSVMIGFDGEANHITIKNCDFSGVDRESGANPANICVSIGNDVHIEGCEFSGNPSATGIIMFYSGDTVISDNHFHDFNGSAIFAKHKVRGKLEIKNNFICNVPIGIFCNMDDSVIENNIIYNTDRGIWGGNAMSPCGTHGFRNNVIRNNTIVNFKTAGIYLRAPETSCLEGGARDTLISDNIVANIDGLRPSSKHPVCLWEYNAGITGHGTKMRRNIFWDAVPAGSAGEPYVVYEYDRAYTASQWDARPGALSAVGTEENNGTNGGQTVISIPPRFANGAGGYGEPGDFLPDLEAMKRWTDISLQGIGADVSRMKNWTAVRIGEQGAAQKHPPAPPTGVSVTVQ